MSDPNEIFRCVPLDAKLTRQSCGKRFLSVRSLNKGSVGYAAACDGCATGRAHAGLPPIAGAAAAEAAANVTAHALAKLNPDSTRHEVVRAVLFGGVSRAEAAAAKGVSYTSIMNWLKQFGAEVKNEMGPGGEAPSGAEAAVLSDRQPDSTAAAAQVAMKKAAGLVMWKSNAKPEAIAAEVKMSIGVVRSWCAEWKVTQKRSQPPAPPLAPVGPPADLPAPVELPPVEVTLRSDLPAEERPTKSMRALPESGPVDAAGVAVPRPRARAHRTADSTERGLSELARERLRQIIDTEAGLATRQPDEKLRAAHLDVVHVLTGLALA